MKSREYLHLYSTMRWRRIRKAQMEREPLCRMCKAKGRIKAARVCDHIAPHKGDEALFFSGPFQSLCTTCHDSVKQREEHTGKVAGCDVSGYPDDPNHTWNR